VPWVRAILRGQKIYARADARGALAAVNGRVEIRYKPNDGRRYEAREGNLEVVEATPLPDETCGPAEAAPKADKAAGATKVGSEGSGARSGGGDGGGNASASASAKGAKSAKAVTSAQVTPAEGSVIAYADGACSGNPGPAGLGVVLIDGKHRIELSEYLGVGTNNIAELTAVLRALSAAPAGKPLLIYTDSQYTIGVLQKGWKAKANTELIAELRSMLAGRGLARLAYVPGHAGVILNERADALAREAVSARKTRRQEFGAPPTEA
jgi:ribonuclease HI